MQTTTSFQGFEGVLPDHLIRALLSSGAVGHASAANVGSSSLDTSVGGECYRTAAGALPKSGQSVRNLIASLPGVSRHSVGNPLHAGGTYLIRLNECLALPPDVYGYANPKSSTGRSDILVRLLADGVSAYDTIPKGYKGDLWLEVRPLSFSCQMPDRHQFNQIRFFTANTLIKTPDDLLRMNQSYGPLLFSPEGEPVTLNENLGDDGSLLLSVFMGEGVGYESRATSAVLDLSSSGGIEPTQFFVPVETTDGFLFLKKDHFYILSSCERVRVPQQYACEMRAMDSRLGEVRVHYAGYIDCGWGGDTGDQLTLEVRPQEDILLQPGQPIARIVFEQMAAPAEKPYTTKRSSYVGQTGPSLAKYFKKR